MLPSERFLHDLFQIYSFHSLVVYVVILNLCKAAEEIYNCKDNHLLFTSQPYILASGAWERHTKKSRTHPLSFSSFSQPPQTTPPSYHHNYTQVKDSGFGPVVFNLNLLVEFV